MQGRTDPKTRAENSCSDSQGVLSDCTLLAHTMVVYLLVRVNSFRVVLRLQDEDQFAHCIHKASSVGVTREIRLTYKGTSPSPAPQNGCLCRLHYQQSRWADLFPGQSEAANRGPAALQVPAKLCAGGGRQGRHGQVWRRRRSERYKYTYRHVRVLLD